MEMQDKEFDKLFSSKLEGFEIEPSTAVWQGISEGLGDKKRRKMIPLLSIAASIIVMIAAGVLFIAKKDAVVKPQPKNRIAFNKPVKINAPVIKRQPTVNTTKPVTVAINTVGKPARTAKNNQSAAGNIAPADQPVKMNERQVLAALPSAKNEIKRSIAIDSSGAMATVILPAAHQPDKAVTIAALPENKSSILPDAGTIKDTPPAKRHGIHGLGDVFNMVIAAVDKRKDKVIEFADTDDDGASIKGVNFGPIKVKSNTK